MAYATTPIHGKTCRVEKNSTVVDFTDGWNIDTTIDMADISRQGQAFKEGLPGQASWSGSFSGQFVMGNTEQAAIVGNLITASPGTKLTDIEFNLDTTANKLSGNIYITSVGINASVGDKVSLTVNFQGDGALAIAAA